VKPVRASLGSIPISPSPAPAAGGGGGFGTGMMSPAMGVGGAGAGAASLLLRRSAARPQPLFVGGEIGCALPRAHPARKNCNACGRSHTEKL
jgi:hypothetical protein